MKPIIVDMKDMSDSTEVYASRPNRFLVYTVYTVFLILVIALVWMACSKIDLVVKSKGIFKGSNAVYEINSGVTGSVKESHVVDGQSVREGDVLYVLNIDELSDTMVSYREKLSEAGKRLEILAAYKESLDGDAGALERLKDNPFYEEFTNRRDLLYANIGLNRSDSGGQSAIHQENIHSISDSIGSYQEKIKKLNQVKKCILARRNDFPKSESQYYTMVNSYLTSYDYSAMQYDNQMEKLQKEIEEITARSETLQKKAKTREKANDVKPGASQPATDAKALKKQKEEAVSALNTLKSEKEQALSKMESQEINAVEQQISGYEDSIFSLKSNLSSAKMQLESATPKDEGKKENVAILTEKRAVDSEILTNEEKKKECENYLKSYDIKNDHCTVKANASGNFHAARDMKIGSYLQEGTAIGQIYPEEESKYYADLYVENSDIGRIKEGDEVKFEIAAYPADEYGYFSGKIVNIAKDITVDRNTGYSYYPVKVKCENISLKGKDGEEASLRNGMACEAKIVIGEKDVLTYVLEKIDLLD